MARKKAEVNGDTIMEPVPVDDPPLEHHDHDEPHRPVTTIRYGFVKVCVWRNETEQGVRYNCTFARIYRLGDSNEWGQSTSFGPRDLPLIEKCAAAALEWVRGQYDDQTPF